MDELSRLYVEHLRIGLMLTKYALDAGDFEWARAEIDLNHNIPGLIEESNFRRHAFFWNQERDRYRNWVSAAGHPEAMSKMRTFYEPLWDEMKPYMTRDGRT